MWLAVASSASARVDAPEPGRDAPGAVVEYWTIEANEGQSAGGHAAIRIGDTVHHLEHRGDGLITDRRDPRDLFEQAYRGRGNRSIDVLTLDVTPAQRRRLAARLKRRSLERQLALDALERLEETARWLDGAIASGTPSVAVPGLGLFGAPRAGCGAEHVAPRAEVSAARRRARRDRDQALAAIVRPETDAARRGRGPVDDAYHRLLEATQRHAALRVIEECRALRPGALRVVPGMTRLEEPDRAALRRTRDALGRDLARLVSSPRPDRGLALLLVWARREAAARSLERDRWLVLDAFAEREGARSRPAALPAPWRAQRERGLHARLENARASLREWPAETGGLEPALDQLERIAHDLRHVEAGTRHDRGTPLGALEASRALERPGAVVALAWPVDLTIPELEASRAAIAADAAERRRALERDIGYDLFRRNCVTELLAVLDAEDIAPDADEAPGGFVPAVARAWLGRLAPVAATSARPSARRVAIEAAVERDDTIARGSSVGLRLRESNTLSSRLYRSHAEDSAFLVFAADTPIPIRPLAGLANLVWGTGASVVGLATWPFDRGRRLERGLRGVAMSVPELFFFGIRKGSYAVSPPLPVLGPD